MKQASMQRAKHPRRLRARAQKTPVMLFHSFIQRAKHGQINRVKADAAKQNRKLKLWVLLVTQRTPNIIHQST